MKDPNKPNKDDEFNLSDLYKRIESGGLDDDEQEKSGDFEGQFKPRETHGDTKLFDKQDYWERKCQPQMDRVITDCDRIGLPMQACVLLARSANGVSLRHYKTNLVTDETKAAGMIYHLPHGLTHMVLMLTQFPFVLMGGGGFVKEPPFFNHLSTFEEDIVPQVAMLQSMCELMNIPFQIGFVPVVTEETRETRGVIAGKEVPCEFKAAYNLYDAAYPVVYEVISIFNELSNPQVAI